MFGVSWRQRLGKGFAKWRPVTDACAVFCGSVGWLLGLPRCDLKVNSELLFARRVPVVRPPTVFCACTFVHGLVVRALQYLVVSASG